MEDFLGVVVLIVYLIAAASSKKKKAQKKRQKQQKQRAKRKQNVVFEHAFEQTEQPEQTPEAMQGSEPISMEQEACAQQRLHLHEVTQTQLHDAAEGEDPCHIGEAPDRQMEAYDSFEVENEAQNELAQDVLRGVIMSEILRRPCDRMAARGNRRSAV